jgi:hypothetical protein
VSDLDDPAIGICLAHLLKVSRRDMLGARDRAPLRVAYDKALPALRAGGDRL